MGLILMIFLLLTSCGKEENVIFLSGRIEGDEYDVGVKVGGKILEIRVSEGSQVKRGDVLAKLESDEIEAKLRRAKAGLEALKNSVKAKRKEVKILKEKLSSMRIKREILKKEVEVSLEATKRKKDIARSNLARLEHTKRELEARHGKIIKDLERFKELFKKGVIPESKLEEIESEARALEERIKATERGIEELRKRIEIAELEIELARERMKEVSAFDREIASLEETIKAKEEELASLLSRVKEAETVVDEVKALLKDTVIRSPVDGTVVEKMVEEGEVVAPGKRLFTIVNLDRLYFKGYIPETKLGFIRIGQEAFIKVDSFPEKRFPAEISYVSDRAEFTPKEVQTKEARVKQVFAVKLRLKENPDHVLKPGMPAEAFIELR